MATILVVDDDPAVRRVVEVMLKSGGHRVLTAGNGIEGLHVYESRWEEIDLVLTDVLMPEMNGDEFVSRLIHMRHRQRPLHIIFMTGYSDGRTNTEDFVKIRMLAKPMLPEPLLAAVAAELIRNPGL